MVFEHCIFDTWSSRPSILLSKLLDDMTSFRTCCTPKNPNSCYWHKVDIILFYINNQVLMNTLYKKSSPSGSDPISWMINVLKTICSSLCSFGDWDNSAFLQCSPCTYSLSLIAFLRKFWKKRPSQPDML